MLDKSVQKLQTKRKSPITPDISLPCWETWHLLSYLTVYSHNFNSKSDVFDMSFVSQFIGTWTGLRPLVANLQRWCFLFMSLCEHLFPTYVPWHSNTHLSTPDDWWDVMLSMNSLTLHCPIIQVINKDINQFLPQQFTFRVATKTSCHLYHLACLQAQCYRNFFQNFFPCLLISSVLVCWIFWFFVLWTESSGNRCHRHWST